MKLLKSDIKNGVSKDDTFSNFIERGGNPKKGSRFLASIPDSEESAAYAKWNFGLIAIYAILFLVGLVGLLPLLDNVSGKALLIIVGIALIIPTAIIWMLFKQQAIAYIILCFFMIKGILESFKGLEEDPVSVYIGIAINTFILVYAVILKIKLFPFQNFFNSKKDENGVFIYQKF